MTDLLALAARVQALTSACRETDALIWAAVNGYVVEYRSNGLVIATKGDDEKRLGFVDPTPRTNNFYTPDGFFPPVTASLDAAMTLVPEGMCWRLAAGSLMGKYSAACQVFDAGFGVEKAKIETATPALALTAASLLARAALENSHG